MDEPVNLTVTDTGKKVVSSIFSIPINILTQWDRHYRLFWHWLKAPVRNSVQAGDKSSIVTSIVRLLTTWRQICAVCLICRPDDVWDHHSLTSSMSTSRSAQLLETELSLWLVLDYGTVCHMISSRVTHYHGSVAFLF